MKLGNSIPLQIVTGGNSANSVYAGGKRIWGRERSTLWNEIGYFNTYTQNDTSWILNGGNGKSVAAFRLGNSDINFGGVTWHRGVSPNGETFGSANGISFHYSQPGVSWANTANGASNISAFSDFAWSPGPTHSIDISGFKPGKRYLVQLVIADGRSAANGRTISEGFSALASDYETSMVHNPNIAPPMPRYPRESQYAFGDMNRYGVLSFTFIPLVTNIIFFPRIWPNEIETFISNGTQINAIHIIEDVLPSDGNTRFTNNYYVSSSSGNDNNDGSRDRPWASLAKVNSMTFQPGDRILFKRGDSWTGRLTPQGSGTANNPILLGAYSDGAHPKIDAAGAPWGAIALTNQSYWIIDGFEVCSWVDNNNEWYRHGIIVNNDDGGTGIIIRNNIVRDIFGGRSATGDQFGLLPGAIPGRHCGGISVLDRFGGCNDIIIENNQVYNAVSVGIQIWGPDGATDGPLDWSKLLLRCIIRGNVVWGSACDNILYQGCRDIVVENNHSGFCGLQGVFPSAIGGLWGTRSYAGLVQFNHSHNTLNWQGNGEAFDATGLGIDLLTDGVVTIQYNFTHDNYGGAVADYQTPIFIGGTLVYRYNVSVNESRIPVSRSTCQHLHNIYYSPDDTLQIHWGSQNLTLKNSIIVMDQLESSISSSTLDNNIWWNMESKPSNDVNGLYLDPNFVNQLPKLICKDEYVSYDAGDPNTPVAGNQLERRYFGKVKNLVYNTWGSPDKFWVGRARALELISLTASEACSLNINLAEHAQGPLLVRMIARNITSSDPTNWLAACFSNTPYSSKPFVTTHNFGMLFRQNGGTQCFSGGSLISSDEFPWTDERGSNINHIISFVFSDTAGTGNAFVGNGTRVQAYSNGVLLGDYNISQMSACYFAYNLLGSEWRVRQLYITSRQRDEDAYDDYMNMMPTSNLKDAVAITEPTTDFFNRLVDLDGPSVGPFEFNSPSPVITEPPVYVEVNGRSQCRKSSSVTRQFNYNIIVRDRNFRIASAPITLQLLPAGAAGVSLSSNGVLSVAPNATPGRYAIKATSGSTTTRFSFSIV